MHTFQRFMVALFGACLFLVAGASWAQSSPLINTFTVQQVSELAPGTELLFKLTGSAGGSGSLSIDGTANTVALEETRAGVYEGAYTINRRDKITYSSQVKATLKIGETQTTAVLGQTLLTSVAHKAAIDAATPAPVIDYFATQVNGTLVGGNEVVFTVRGTPGGKVGATVSGSDARIGLAEAKPGEYTATYTIRSRDRLTESSTAKVTLTLGSKSVTVQKALSAGPVQPTLAARQKCETCGIVQAIDEVEVEGKPGYGGAIAGGVAGVLLGSQVGKGSGQTAAQVLGAVGGAYAGREIEKKMKKEKHFDVTVRLHNGGTQTVRHDKDPGLKVGQQVKVVNGEVLVNE